MPVACECREAACDQGWAGFLGGAARVVGRGCDAFAGPGAEPPDDIDAWLVCDEHAELARELRRLAAVRGLDAHVGAFDSALMSITPHAVVHTSHETFGYLALLEGKRVVWAPEFLQFPEWARGSDLMFADAAGWDRPIRFARGAGGHSCVRDVARAAAEHGVRRVVYAHIGRPTIAAMDSCLDPPVGEFGADGAVYVLPRRAAGAG